VLYSQTVIKGNIKDFEKTLVPNISVVVYDINENLLAYAISDFDGNYSLTFSTNLKNVDLKIKGFNFETISETIVNTSQIKNFVLKPSVTQLKEVILKESIIQQKGDTISYNVASFASEKDRTLADVLSKMPGIDVLPDGKILYQGKPINKYYIEGLDLLEGKYNLANKNLPFNQVSKVQVLENHQPIKLLDSLTFSDNAALNIKLKNIVSFTGQAELGVGTNPLLYHANITPMLFSKTKQVIVSYQGNNIGNNISNQNKVLTIEDLIDKFDANNEKEDWLSIQTLSKPSFSEKRWLNNNTHLASVNFLQKLKNELQLKVNVSYFNDYQQQNGYTQTNFYTLTDTIKLLEIKQNKIFTNNLDANFTLEQNTKKKYLKNKFQYKVFWDSQTGYLNTNNLEVKQRLSNQFFTVNNDFKRIFGIGKQLFTLHSNVVLSKTPQNLLVSPGQFEDLINNGDNYEFLKQNVKSTKLMTNNVLHFTKALHSFTINQRVGFLYENENLDSEIFVTNTILNSSGFQNNLSFNKYKIYLDLQIQYKKNNWQLQFKAPVNSYFFKWQNIQSLNNQKNKLVFEPKINISNELNAFWKISTSYNRSYQFGKTNQIYNGYILTNYRNIQRFNAVLPESSSNSYNLGVTYKNPVTSWFGYVFYTFSNTLNNILYNSSINQAGASEVQTVNVDNKRKTHNLNFRLSKYISNIKSNFTLNSSLTNSSFFQLINNDLNEISNNNLMLDFKIDSEISDWFEVEVKSNIGFSKNKIEDSKNKTIVNQLHALNLNFYPKEQHYFTFNTEFLINNSFNKNNKYNFLDFLYRYTWKKKNIDFEFQLNNVFNTESYTTISVSDFSYIETNFQLRPRQVFFKMRFSL
jgi:hypothetical protein